MGDEAHKRLRLGLTLQYPIGDGIVTNWDDMDSLVKKWAESSNIFIRMF